MHRTIFNLKLCLIILVLFNLGGCGRKKHDPAMDVALNEPISTEIMDEELSDDKPYPGNYTG